MIKQAFNYLRIRNSDVLHKVSVAELCHYFERRATLAKDTTIKKRTDRICDECQRLEREQKKLK